MSSGPAGAHQRREAEHRDVLLDHAAQLAAQRRRRAVTAGRRSSTGCPGSSRPGRRPPRRCRSLTSSAGRRRRAPCSCSPVANSRWITRSCRSRAIRSRSATSISSSRSDTAWARSRASDAWSANDAEQLAPRRSRGPRARRRDHQQHAAVGEVGAQRDQHGGARSSSSGDHQQVALGLGPLDLRPQGGHDQLADVVAGPAAVAGHGGDLVAAVVTALHHRDGRGPRHRAQRQRDPARAPPRAPPAAAARRLSSADASSHCRRRSLRAKARAFSITKPAARASASTSCSSSSVKSLAAGLLGQVEVAEHRAPDAHRHPEERLHRRVVGREAVGRRVRLEVARAAAARARSISRPRMPLPARQVADLARAARSSSPDGHEVDRGRRCRRARPARRTARRSSGRRDSTIRSSTLCRSRSELIATTASSRAPALRGRSRPPAPVVAVMDRSVRQQTAQLLRRTEEGCCAQPLAEPHAGQLAPPQPQVQVALSAGPGPRPPRRAGSPAPPPGRRPGRPGRSPPRSSPVRLW